jgi:hypothetical protein
MFWIALAAQLSAPEPVNYTKTKAAAPLGTAASVYEVETSA